MFFSSVSFEFLLLFLYIIVCVPAMVLTTGGGRHGIEHNMELVFIQRQTRHRRTIKSRLLYFITTRKEAARDSVVFFGVLVKIKVAKRGKLS